MLNKRLREKNMFSDEQAKLEAKKHEARKMLNTCVRDLITCMKSAEMDGLLSTEEVENFVIKRMSYYEEMIYPMDADSFSAWLSDQLIRRIREVLK